MHEGFIGSELKEQVQALMFKKICGSKHSEEVLLPLSVKNIIQDALGEAEHKIISRKKGVLYCGICGNGPFTKKGLCMHVRRVHKEDVERMIEDLLVESLSQHYRRF